MANFEWEWVGNPTKGTREQMLYKAAVRRRVGGTFRDVTRISVGDGKKSLDLLFAWNRFRLMQSANQAVMDETCGQTLWFTTALYVFLH